MKKTDKLLNRQRRVTIVFGYSLFLFTLVILTMFTVIPFTSLLFNPTVTRHLNALIILIALTLGAILPTVLSYVMGDSATHTKNKTSHHYNGVLFGIASYWLAILFMFIRIETTPNIMMSIAEPWSSIIASWPVLATIIVMLFVSITYAKNQKNKSSVLQHRPYQIVLVGSFAALSVYLAVIGDYSIGVLALASIASLILQIILIIIAYKVLAKSRPSKAVRLSEAVITITISGIAVSLVSQLIGQLSPLITVFDLVVPQLVGVCVWAVYLWLVLRRS
ncbi:MAG: hypothetical protein JWN26_331 [Candidatus Saccharibacteria bacterium]|nr:hypothetical protein [Candidatus Saccharibacteria bacterium]